MVVLVYATAINIGTIRYVIVVYYRKKWFSLQIERESGYTKSVERENDRVGRESA